MTVRSFCRVLRWAGLAAVAPLLWACNARSLERPALKPESTFGKTFQQTINRNVDLLFLVDDSSSMRLSQDNLRRNFPVFMQRLMEPPGLPNIHVAVVSSDMGAGDGSVVGVQRHRRSARDLPLHAHDATARHSRPARSISIRGRTFITNIGGQANYTGSLEDTFSCMAALWEGGCGYRAPVCRHPARARRRRPRRPRRRTRASSAPTPTWSSSSSPTRTTAPRRPAFRCSTSWSNPNIASQLGPSSNFRCNEFGHLCDDGSGNAVHPSRNAPGNDVAATVTYQNCRSNDQEGYLLGVVDTANRIKALKADPSQVMVASIQGPATPVHGHLEDPTTADTSCGAASCPWPIIAHSCEAADGSFADPGVRTGEFVNQFGANGLLLPICAADFGPSLDRIATQINTTLQPPCITQRVASKPGTPDPDCTVVSHTSNGLGGFVDAAVPYCGSNGNAAPCWKLTPGGTSCAAGQIVDVSSDPNLPTSTAQNATVNCALCDPNVPDPARCP